jgi:hypothetical protein
MQTSNLYTIEKQSGKTPPTPLNLMDAIAHGVQARFEESTGYSKRVTDATINVAKALGVPESEIERWAAHRLNRISHEAERLREIKSLLDRLYGSSFGIASENNQ